MSLHVGVIGAGAVGAALGKRLQAAPGFVVRYGARWGGAPGRLQAAGARQMPATLRT